MSLDIFAIWLRIVPVRSVVSNRIVATFAAHL